MKYKYLIYVIIIVFILIAIINRKEIMSLFQTGDDMDPGTNGTRRFYRSDDAPILAHKQMLNNLTHKLNSIRSQDISDSVKLSLYRQAVAQVEEQSTLRFMQSTSAQEAQDCICEKGIGSAQCWVWNGVIFFVQFCSRKCCRENSAVVSNTSTNTMF